MDIKRPRNLPIRMTIYGPPYVTITMALLGLYLFIRMAV
jgi:hypothetical protein